MKSNKLVYGKVLHIVLESGKVFKSIEELDRHIKKKYKPINEYLNLKDRKKFLQTIWKRIKTKPPINYRNFINSKIRQGYKIFVEKPLLQVSISGTKRISYKVKKLIPDVILYNPKNKDVIIIDIKSGTKRRIRSYKKQVRQYRDIAKKIFNTRKVDIYLYFYRYDELKKID